MTRWIKQMRSPTPVLGPWIDVKERVPESVEPRCTITTLAVIDDPRFRLEGEDPFVDIAAYWPAAKKWTVTHQTRADKDATDHECRVTYWTHLLELPLVPGAVNQGKPDGDQ